MLSHNRNIYYPFTFTHFFCIGIRFRKQLYFYGNSLFDLFAFQGEIFLLRPLDEISSITHIGDPVLLTIVAEEVKVTRDEPPAMASTVQLAFFLPERSNSPPYFENDQLASHFFQKKK